MKNAVVIIPMGMPWKWSTDYYEQTAIVLAKHNTVLCIQSDNVPTLKNIIIQRSLPKVITKIHPNVYQFTPIDIIPFRRFPLIAHLNFLFEAFLSNLIIWFIGIYKPFSKKILWIFEPQFYPLVKSLGRSFIVVYDIVDYYHSGQKVPGLRKLVYTMEKKLLAVADIVTVNSHTLYQLYSHIHPTVKIVPQGFRINSFRRPQALFKETSLVHDHPIIGYVGGINSRLDYQLIRKLLMRNPQYFFIFAGQKQVTNEREYYTYVEPAIRETFSYSNCLYIGNVSKAQIPSLIRVFDICIIPYDAAKTFNRYSYPMKLFEYFYMGKPVISSPIKELKRFPGLVKVGTTAKEWEKHIADILAHPWPKEYIRQQRNLAQENTWEEKICTIEKMLDSYVWH